MRWVLIGLGWLALALVTTRLVSGTARIGRPKDLICPRCGWVGDFGDAAFEIYVDDLESYCPECDGVTKLGSEG